MAKAGGEFGRDVPDPQPDHDGDEQEVNRTQPFQPFQPGASSTPYHGGEQVPMQTMQHEHSGLPDTSYQEETPLLGDFIHSDDKQTRLERYLKNIKDKFPKVDFGKMNPIGFSKKGNTSDIVSFGPKGGESKIFKSGSYDLLKSFVDKNSSALGPRAEDIIVEDRDTIQEMKQREAEAVNQLKQAETSSLQIDEKIKEKEVLEHKIEHVQSRIDAIHDEYGSNLDMEAEVRRLEQQKKNYETDLRDKKKELASLQKQAKNIDKIRSNVVRLGADIAEKERKTNALQEKLNQTKPLEDLKEQESELQRQNAEDQAIIQDENASPSDKEAAEGRVVERNEELARLQTQIAERERALPLLERVKEIFKKYGVTATSVLLAAGVTIGVVVSSITNSLKASTKAFGKGLKDIGAKLGSLLPGLIGSIANFLFKAAGQAIGFLAEHTWLLILAVVAFLFEKNLKKRR